MAPLPPTPIIQSYLSAPYMPTPVNKPSRIRVYREKKRAKKALDESRYSELQRDTPTVAQTNPTSEKPTLSAPNKPTSTDPAVLATQRQNNSMNERRPSGSFRSSARSSTENLHRPSEGLPGALGTDGGYAGVKGQEVKTEKKGRRFGFKSLTGGDGHKQKKGDGVVR